MSFVKARGRRRARVLRRLSPPGAARTAHTSRLEIVGETDQPIMKHRDALSMEVTPETARDAARLTGLATLFILARLCLRARVLPSKCPRAREVRSKDEFGAVGA